jgi:hypothetical protein
LLESIQYSPTQDTAMPSINRRSFLRAAGVTVALPMLESVSEASPELKPNVADAPAKRLVCVGSNLGYYRKAFYPEQSGKDYVAPELLTHVDQHRSDYTVFSGLDHRAGNGHGNWDNFLCGPKIKSISLDQIVAEQVGHLTRIPSMQLCAGGIPNQQKVSYTRRGVPLPMTERPSVVFKKMFSSKENRARTDYLLRSGQSSLDTVLEEAKSLQKTVSGADRKKLGEYFSSVREVEKRMTRQLDHLADDAPEVEYQLPAYDPIAPTLMIEAQQIMYDLLAIALQTDSTRVATMFLAGLGQVFTLEGVTLRAGYHALSHHGGDAEMIRDLVRVESEHLKCLNRFLNQLKTKTDADGQPLLDSTIVLFGTGMGDASVHNNSDTPTLVAGGGFDHGKHIAIDRKAKDAHLLGDLYITLLNQLGIEADTFANANRKMDI